MAGQPPTAASTRGGAGGTSTVASAGRSEPAGLAGTTEGAAGTPEPSAKPRALGSACSNAGQCDSAACVDGVCCSSTECGECQSCSKHGTCAAVPLGMSDDTCNKADYSCGVDAICALSNGVACSGGGAMSDSQHCASGACENLDFRGADRVCCAQKCEPCQTCAADGSKCSPIRYGNDPGACEGSTTCTAGACSPVGLDHMYSSEPQLLVQDAAFSIGQILTTEMPGSVIEVRLRTSCRGQISIQGVRSSDGMPDGQEKVRTDSAVEIEALDPTTGLGLTAFPVRIPLRVLASQRLSLVMPHNNCRSATVGAGTALPGEVIHTNNGSTWQASTVSLRFMLVYQR